ncbi:hypothetical protein F7O43_09570 [Neisseria meningitidis]|nr:hypothetical protein [Neisseria meningitidis]MCG8964059.1 hypothetical protein [Neisseria meningitidis]MCI3178455.1 hypothetical protein [Neisseria meningitidis]TNL06926.1 hypothetical protein ETU18_05055 [Neisseria meningitidis]TNL10286.1 hypothetical protein EUY00_07420 [Neisseria meningitidis]
MTASVCRYNTVSLDFTFWIPACAGMTASVCRYNTVSLDFTFWIPACAGMTAERFLFFPINS